MDVDTDPALAEEALDKGVSEGSAMKYGMHCETTWMARWRKQKGQPWRRISLAVRHASRHWQSSERLSVPFELACEPGWRRPLPLRKRGVIWKPV